MVNVEPCVPDAVGRARRYRRSVLLATPLLLAVPVAYGLAFHFADVPTHWLAGGAGALGWFVALNLRAPVGLLAKRLVGTPQGVQSWVTAASGPAEESVRLVALLLLGRSFPLAFWVGLGWSAIEVIYTIANGFALAALRTRTDEKALQARELLASMGLDKVMESTPLLGVIERIFASALHIGFTLLIAFQPWLALLTMLWHSATNIVVLRLLRRSVLLSEGALALGGAVAFVAGLAVFGRL